MKKHNEGYALPFVLVVLVVLCIIAVGIMDFSLRNLESQQATIQRMEAKYEAAGQIERIVAAMQTDRGAEASGIPFYESEQLTFRIPGQSNLRVAASGVNGEEAIWVIAEIKPGSSDWRSAITIDEQNKILTVKYCETADFLWYELVDWETAERFLAGDYPAGEGA